MFRRMTVTVRKSTQLNTGALAPIILCSKGSQILCYACLGPPIYVNKGFLIRASFKTNIRSN